MVRTPESTASEGAVADLAKGELCYLIIKTDNGTLVGDRESVEGRLLSLDPTKIRGRGRWSRSSPSMRLSGWTEEKEQCCCYHHHTVTCSLPFLMSEPSEPSTEPTAELSYNVRWMTKTFNSRSAVESLLGPQRAAGVVSSHDYDAAMSFLPGFHRFYGVGVVSLSGSTLC